MAVNIKLKRGSADAIRSYVGSAGELVIDTTNWGLVVCDGKTAGGKRPVMAINGTAPDESGNVTIDDSQYAKLNEDNTFSGTTVLNGIHRDQYYASNVCRHMTTARPTEYVIKTKIVFASSKYMPVVRLYGYAYGLNSPIELRIGFYVYEEKLGWCGVVSTGAWKPEVYLYKYTENSTEYIAIGLKGECYFCAFQVDVQAGASGNTFGEIFNPEGWTTADNGADTSVALIPAVGTNGCILVPYQTMKTDISGNAATASYAVNDSKGQQISTTYIKGLSATGKTITYTKGDGTTGSITTQDTTYSAGVGLSLSGTTFSNAGVRSVAAGTSANQLSVNTNGTTATITINNVANATAAGSATKATQDSAGQQINKTYIKGLSVSGKTITYTKGDDTTGSITTQDTTYSAGTGLSLSGTTFTNSGVRSIKAGTTANQLSVDTNGTTSTITINNVANATTASSANALSTARTITLGGDLSGSVSFDGSENVTLTATVADDSHNHTIANIDNLQTTLNAKAPLASPTFTGTPSAPTATDGTNTTQVATTQFVQSATSKCLPLEGGTMKGALNMGNQHINGANYVYAQWYSIGASIASSTAAKEILIKQGGWIYSRTPSQILSDIGAASASEVATLASRVSALEADFSNFMTKTEYQNEVDTAYAAIS